MGYRIEYQSTQRKYVNVHSYIRLPVLILLCFAVFLFLVETMWPEGSVLIKKAVCYPKGVMEVSALNDLANELRHGEALAAALAEFCRKLVS